jgi:hypothetical protein
VEYAIDFLSIESFWFIPSARPFQQFLVLGVIRFTEHVKQAVVARNTSAICLEAVRHAPGAHSMTHEKAADP